MTAFEERLRHQGLQRYHHEHPFHMLMHQGQLTPHQLQQWVLNRYYYQTRIPIKRCSDPQSQRTLSSVVCGQKTP